ncbi:MAG: M48 family metallopeptidase [Nitrososphaera sp.]|uniref:M48 family metallopeptidase n=1 Tax=Nitrososphaera sp. TaxID=1971748 RepID=UPI003D6FF5E5
MILPLADGRALEIKVRTSARARHFRLVSGIGGVEAVVPPGYDEGGLARFVESKKSWIARTAQHYDMIRERTGHEDGALYYLGSRYRYHVIKDRLPSATMSEGMKVVTFHVTDKRSYRRHITAWYREQTRSIIAERLPAIAATMGLQYNRVAIKSQRSRWASCSKKRNLNFNLLLSAAPVDVIDYVIVHELAHILELNHSKRFWDIVASADPGFEKHKEWLDDHSPVIGVESL